MSGGGLYSLQFKRDQAWLYYNDLKNAVREIGQFVFRQKL